MVREQGESYFWSAVDAILKVRAASAYMSSISIWLRKLIFEIKFKLEMTDTSYNKHTTTRNGTLIANWQEERALKEFSGEARYVEFQTLYFYFDRCKHIV